MQQIGHSRQQPSLAPPSIDGNSKSTPISTLLLNLTSIPTNPSHKQLHYDPHLPEPHHHQHQCGDHQCHPRSDLGHRSEVSTRIHSSRQHHTITTQPIPTSHNLTRSSTTITRITLDSSSDNDDNRTEAEDAADNRPITNHQEYHQRLAVAEALARTSMMTSPAARRRLAARQVEMDMMSGGGDGDDDDVDLDYDHIDYVPPKQLLMYMVR